MKVAAWIRVIQFVLLVKHLNRVVQRVVQPGRLLLGDTPILVAGCEHRVGTQQQLIALDAAASAMFAGLVLVLVCGGIVALHTILNCQLSLSPFIPCQPWLNIIHWETSPATTIKLLQLLCCSTTVDVAAVCVLCCRSRPTELVMCWVRPCSWWTSTACAACTPVTTAG